ncbi:MAG: hypothetical protein R6X25_08985 [Candidatus Krumholzibacteriia bacterium]
MKTNLSMLSTVLLVVAALTSLASARPALPEFPGQGSFADLLQDDIVVPPEWAGIFDVDLALYDCATDILLFAASQQDTICTGDSATDPGDDTELTFTCSGGFDGNTFSAVCDGSAEIEPGCTQTLVATYTGSLSGDTVTVVAVADITYSGATCVDVEDSCIRIETTSVRVGPEPPSCGQTPAESGTWSAVKDIYR